MEHVVFYPSADGSPAFRRVSSLDEAVRFVEHLRNIEDVSDFSVHELTEVPLSFKAYYKAELPGGHAEDASASVEVPSVAAPAEPVDSAEHVEQSVSDTAADVDVPHEVADELVTAPTSSGDELSDEADADVPSIAGSADELPVAEVPSPSEPVEEMESAPAETRKSLSFFAR